MSRVMETLPEMGGLLVALDTATMLKGLALSRDCRLILTLEVQGPVASMGAEASISCHCAPPGRQIVKPRGKE